MLNILKDVLLKDLTTLGIGGPAKEFSVVKNLDELKEALRHAKENNLEVLVIGGGSNLLISDQGFDGLIIKNDMTGIAQQDDTVIVKSGTPLQDLVDFTIENGLSGTNRLTGIPGTVAGAVYGNAGAYGQTISDFIDSVSCLTDGEEKTLTKTDCNFSYRDSHFKESHFIILEIHFKFPGGNTAELKKESEETLIKRQQKYKPGIKCPGSFFKNVLMENLSEEQKKLIPPERDTYGKVPAWFFLDEVDARGVKKGAIEVADFHGNLFINMGGGVAQDFYDLAKNLKEKVKQKFGVSLEPEVQLVGLPPL